MNELASNETKTPLDDIAVVKVRVRMRGRLNALRCRALRHAILAGNGTTFPGLPLTASKWFA
jgi:hypothetical protein